VGGDLIRRITSCPRVIAPVVRRRFSAHPGSRFRIPVMGLFRRRKTKTGRTFCRRAVALVSAWSGQRGGRAWGGGGRSVRPEHRKGTTLILPPGPSMGSVGHPCVVPTFILSFCFLRKQGSHSRKCRRVPQYSVSMVCRARISSRNADPTTSRARAVPCTQKQVLSSYLLCGKSG